MANDAQAATSRDERAWVRRAQAGSASDFEALFRAHWAPAYRAAYLVVRDAAAAEDIAQEAFLAAVRALDRFDRRRPFGPWLHRIVVNRAIDWARARALRAEAEHVDAPAPDAAASATRNCCASSTALSPEHRAVIVLRYVLDYTPGEIARAARAPARNRQLASAPGARRPRRSGCSELTGRSRTSTRPASAPGRVVRAAYESREPVAVAAPRTRGRSSRERSSRRSSRRR